MQLRTVCSYPDCPRMAYSRGRCGLHPWRPSTRAARKQRDRALRRTHGRCVVCGAPAVVAHHVVERQHGGSDMADNLVALCAQHHDEAHDYASKRA